MYRKQYGYGFGKGGGSQDTSDLPQALKNRGQVGKKRRNSAPSLRKRHTYGPPKNKGLQTLDMRFLRRRYPSFFVELDKKDKEKEKEEEEAHIPEKEAEDLPTLTVKKINFLMRGCSGGGGQQGTLGNAKRHKTDRYESNKTADGQPVLRRGQEFKICVTFNRPFNKEQDDLSFYMEADENPGKGLQVNFKMDEERKKPFDPLPHWAGRLKKENKKKCSIRVAIYIPYNCVVAEWYLKVKTTLRGVEQSLVYTHPTAFIVLFNPWCKEDQVYYSDDPKHLNEYILNPKSTAYYGTSYLVQCKAWNYGHFDKDMVQICLSLVRQAFGFKMTSAMADPVIVSRALSRVVNCSDDMGVLVGNWSGNYEGGARPTSWVGSPAILKQFEKEASPVKFGQCWVFSHVLTAVCRALGLPCRSVTNFDSAHDTDNSCTIDCYYDSEGNELKHMKSDSIWNFHVWNEVWLNRPEIKELDCNGWHVIDATPQEQSDGVYQCGPSPLKAIKNGWIHIPYDTGFIFSEVNADVVHWVCDDDGEYTPSAYKKRSVGSSISTKPPDGKPWAGRLDWKSQNDPTKRQDLTDQYKHKEGSAEEREAVQRAVRQGSRGQNLFVDLAEIEVEFDKESGKATVGEPLKVVAIVKNVSKEEKEVAPMMSCRVSSYWNSPDKNKELCKIKPPNVMLKPGKETKIELVVPYDTYIKDCNEDLTLYFYAKAQDVKKNMPHTAQQPIQLAVPGFEMKGPTRSKPKQAIPVKMAFTNPLNVPLTNCTIMASGDLYFTEADIAKNNWEESFWTLYMNPRNIGPKETKVFQFEVYWDKERKVDDDESDEDEDEDEGGAAAAPPEEEEETVDMTFELSCTELKSDIVGTHTVTCDWS